MATYFVRDGVDILVDQETGAADLDVRSYLMGSLFAVLCHQRGLLPLHASAIAGPQGAVAFLGASGAGKSSIAAFLSRRGHRVLADDICLVDPAAPRDQRVLPVAPWLKLWSTTLDAMGESDRGLPRVFSDDEKYRYALQQHEASTPLAEIILLERARGPDCGELRAAARRSMPFTRCLTSPTSRGWCEPWAEPNNIFCAAARLSMAFA